MKYAYLLLFLLLIASCQTSPTQLSNPTNSSPLAPHTSHDSHSKAQETPQDLPTSDQPIPLYLSKPFPNVNWGNIISTAPPIEQDFDLINDTKYIYVLNRVMTGGGGCIPYEVGEDKFGYTLIQPQDTFTFQLHHIIKGRSHKKTKSIRLLLYKFDPADTTTALKDTIRSPFKFYGNIMPVVPPATLYFRFTLHLFDPIPDSLQQVSHTFEGVNVGPHPIHITSVKTNDGGSRAYTTSKDPILPNDTVHITFTQNLHKRERFEKRIKIVGFVLDSLKQSFVDDRLRVVGEKKSYREKKIRTHREKIKNQKGH